MTRAMSRVALYAAVGPELRHYELDVEAATLTARGAVRLPANVQYAWPHASRRVLYMGSSDSPTGRGSFAGGNHCLSALAIDPASGALSARGEPVALPTRPIHLTTDIPSTHVLVALTNPSRIQVYATREDGSIAGEVRQAGETDAGSYAHQVRVRPDNCTAIVTDRGIAAGGNGAPAPSGCLRVFDYASGRLTPRLIVAPRGEHGFGPRHLDFHPSRPWVYVVLEAQNRLAMLAFKGPALHLVCERDTLVDPGANRARQAASTVHVHPNGRTVYVANRASSTTSMRSEGVSGGGENTIAVFAIDPANGEPKRVQSIDAGGIHCRTFHIDPSGRLLVAAHAVGAPSPDANGAQRPGPGALALFHIAEDGTLAFRRKYDIEVGPHQLFWMGMVEIGASRS